MRTLIGVAQVCSREALQERITRRETIAPPRLFLGMVDAVCAPADLQAPDVHKIGIVASDGCRDLRALSDVA